MANQIIDKALAYIGNWMRTGKPVGYGTNVDITSYTSTSNMYTIPSDGIIEINCNYRAGSYIMVYIFNATGTNSSALVQQSAAAAGDQGNSYAQCPVFKGQRVYVQTSNTYSYAYFKPFIYGIVGGGKTYSFIPRAYAQVVA